jgi:hypothetical protein
MNIDTDIWESTHQNYHGRRSIHAKVTQTVHHQAAEVKFVLGKGQRARMLVKVIRIVWIDILPLHSHIQVPVVSGLFVLIPQ